MAESAEKQHTEEINDDTPLAQIKAKVEPAASVKVEMKDAEDVDDDVPLAQQKGTPGKRKRDAEPEKASNGEPAAAKLKVEKDSSAPKAASKAATPKSPAKAAQTKRKRAEKEERCALYPLLVLRDPDPSAVDLSLNHLAHPIPTLAAPAVPLALTLLPQTQNPTAAPTPLLLPLQNRSLTQRATMCLSLS